MHHIDTSLSQHARLSAQPPRARAVAAQPDQLWSEHGWALGSGTVGAILAVILGASIIVQVFG